MSSVETYWFGYINGLSIDQLLPPPSKQKELLNSVILNLTEEEFEARMVTTFTESERMLPSNLGVEVHSSNDTRIEVDESQGVFGFWSDMVVLS